MREYIIIPESVHCYACKECGARPVIASAGPGEYLVKCPVSDKHYQTQAGLIDIDDWNLHNIPNYETELEGNKVIACYDTKLNYTFFLPA